jgi:hypothetical protein
VTVGLLDVPRLQQQSHGHRRQSRMFERLDAFDEVRARRPGKIVDVFGFEVVDLLLLASRGHWRRCNAGRANRPALRHHQHHVVGAEVGEELGGGMELVRVPFTGILKHAELWEPVRDEVVLAEPARARERPRHLRGPGDVDVNRLARQHRRGQRHRQHRAVLHVSIVRRHKRRAGAKILAARHNGQEIDRPPVVLGPDHLRTTGREGLLAHPRRVRIPPRVPVQVKPQVARRGRRDVAPDDAPGT